MDSLRALPHKLFQFNPYAANYASKSKKEINKSVPPHAQGAMGSQWNA